MRRKQDRQDKEMSGDLIVIQNCMSHQGMRNLHVMSNQVIDQDQVLRRFAQSPNPYRLQVRPAR